MLFRNKPIVVDAFPWPGPGDFVSPDWYQQAVINEVIRPATLQQSAEDQTPSAPCLVIFHNEKQQVVQVGDYILREESGELSACRAEIFNFNFEALV